MKLPEEIKSELEKELKYVSDRIIAEEDMRRKVFFYSGAYGVTRRILSSYYDPQIVCMDMVLEVSCNAITERIESIVSENEKTIPLIDGFFEKLAEAINELANCVKYNKDIYKPLERIAVLAHVTTGFGYYLYTKGRVKI